jgi:hypothetical protein
MPLSLHIAQGNAGRTAGRKGPAKFQFNPLQPSYSIVVVTGLVHHRSIEFRNREEIVANFFVDSSSNMPGSFREPRQ